MEKLNTLMTQPGLATLQRPRFSAGLLLEDEDLNAGVSYTLDLTRLLFKSLFGCGVICGLKVKAQVICKGKKLQISIGKGLALDCMGNPLEVPESQTVVYDPDCQGFPKTIWVAICYTERCCRPKDVSCSPDGDSQSKPTRVRAGYEIKLYDKLPKCVCRCPEAGEEPAGNSGRHGCCDDDDLDVNIQGQGGQPPEDPCACYSAHFRGECEGDCGCTCVLIAKVLPLEAPKDPAGAPIPGDDRIVNTDGVRRIRPVLTGYAECRWPDPKKRTPVDPAQQPSANN